MKVQQLVAALGLAGALAGCATSAVVADLEEETVIVQAKGSDFAVIEAEAKKGCAIHGRKPVSISKSYLDGYCIRAQYLFACKP